jgi:hypothetical protein
MTESEFDEIKQEYLHLTEYMLMNLTPKEQLVNMLKVGIDLSVNDAKISESKQLKEALCSLKKQIAIAESKLDWGSVGGRPD